MMTTMIVLFLLQELKNIHVSNHFVPPKISKYEGNVKYLNNYKIYMSMRNSSYALKYRVFHLTLSRATKYVIAEYWKGVLEVE